MKQILIYTYAYNAEKTLTRTIESILAQTYSDWIYYILDNGATDNTGAIINEYASRDSWIVPLVNKKNNVWTPGAHPFEVILREPKCDYFCMLDADDEYKPRFLETMVEFAEKNNLDVAACGNDFIDAATNSFLSIKCLDKNLCLEGRGFSDNFTQVFQFMRTYWAKLSSIPTMLEMDVSRIPSAPYGWDTLFTTELFRCANRVGVLAESLHKYYFSTKSLSFRWDGERIAADRVLDDTARAFLVEKQGAVSPPNDYFLQRVYLYGLLDTINVLVKADIPLAETTACLLDILLHEKTQDLFLRGYVLAADLNMLLRQPIEQWMLQKNGIMQSDDAKMIAGIIALMYEDLPQSSDSANIIVQDAELFSLLANLKNSGSSFLDSANIDLVLSRLLQKHPILQNVGAGLACAFANAICLIIQGDNQKALDNLIAASQDIEIADDDAESFILLGVNLSAAAESADAYVYFKKVWISFLIDSSRAEEAATELEEFEQLFPNDEDFSELRSRLQTTSW